MTTHGNGVLPEGEGVSRDMIKRRLLLVFDSVFEDTDRLCIGDFDWKDLANIVAVHPAVELECGSHDVLFVEVPDSLM
jgi:hypothetical protein